MRESNFWKIYTNLGKNHQKWTQIQLNTVICSYESSLEVFEWDSQSRVLRTKNKAYKADCLHQKVKCFSFPIIWGYAWCYIVALRKRHYYNFAACTNTCTGSLLNSINILESEGNEYIFRKSGPTCHLLQKSSNAWCFPYSNSLYIKRRKLWAKTARTINEFKDGLF